MKRGMRKQLQGDAAGRLQLELGWLSVVESVNNAIANSQTNDNLQVRKSRDCAACDTGLWPVCILDQMVNIS